MRYTAIYLIFASSMMLATTCKLRENPTHSTPIHIHPGLIVEEVEIGSALERAGLKPDDVLHSWERLADSSPGPESSGGDLRTIFDWMWLRVEQAPRGTVELKGIRNSKEFSVEVKPGIWDAKLRPWMPEAALRIYSEGIDLADSGEATRAIRKWENITEDLDDWSLRCWILLRIGQSWTELQNLDKANDTYRLALSQTSDLFVRSLFWRAIGEIYEQQYNATLAYQAHDLARKIRRVTHGESLVLAESLGDLAAVAYKNDDLEMASDHMASALMIRKKFAAESLYVAQSLNDLGHIETKRGNHSRASDYHQRALTIRERLSPESIEVAFSLNNLGHLAEIRGDLDEALGYHQRALAIKQRRKGNSLTLATSLNNIGILASKRGELDRAMDFHQHAFEIRKKLRPGSLLVANSLNNMGTVALKRGDYKRAKKLLQESVAIKESFAAGSIQLAIGLNNLGGIALANQDLEFAEDLFQRSLEIRRKMAPESLNVANALNSLGRLAFHRGRADDAIDVYKHALEIQTSLAPNSLMVSASLGNLGDAALRLGEWDISHDNHLRSLAILEQIAPISIDVSTCLNHLGDIARYRGDLDGALDYFSRALEILEVQLSVLGGSYTIQAAFRDQQAEKYHDILNALLSKKRLAEAFHLWERFRAQTFLAMLAERDVIFKEDISEELRRKKRRIAVHYNQVLERLRGLSLHKHRNEIAEIHRELEDLDDQASDLEASIRFASPRLASLQYPRPLDVDKTREMLDPGTLLLSYSIRAESTTLFSLSRERGVAVNDIDFGEEALKSQVEGFLDSISRPLTGSLASRSSIALSHSQNLYDILLKPVAMQIKASERLLIIPDGPLHSLPFAALSYSDTGKLSGTQYLIESKSIHVALSATVYNKLKQRRKKGTSERKYSRISIFGDPAYPSDGAAVAKGLPGPASIPEVDAIVRFSMERGFLDLKRLPFTFHEAKGIASLFQGAEVEIFLKSEALEERIKDLDPETDILHIAAHGFFDKQRPSSSFIALSIPNRVAIDQDNGILQMWEILEQVRINADLVVLSACESGLGQELGGEGLIGMTRAFQYAGARSVIASLWKVNDRTTAELMIRFYSHLMSGLPKDEALRAAQIEFIHSPIKIGDTEIDASAPYYWAPFQLYGDWQ